MNQYTKQDLENAAAFMDDELREDIHSNFEAGYDNPDAFLKEYIRRHREKFNQDFKWA